jgi:hypothetical protein
MSVAEFNALAPDLYTTNIAPGHEPIPQVIVEEVPDERDQTIALLKDTNDALKAENDRLHAELLANPYGNPQPLAPADLPAGSPPLSFDVPQVPAEHVHDPNYVGECSDGTLVGDPVDNLRSRIKAKLAEKNHRVPDLAAAVGVSPAELADFIDSPNSGFHRTQQGWVKVGAAPVAESSPAAA